MPAGKTTLNFTTSGGSSDADLFIKQASNPTASSYNCKSENSNNNESCDISNPTAGKWHIGIHGYKTVSGANLNATYNP